LCALSGAQGSDHRPILGYAILVKEAFACAKVPVKRSVLPESGENGHLRLYQLGSVTSSQEPVADRGGILR